MTLAAFRRIGATAAAAVVVLLGTAVVTGPALAAAPSCSFSRPGGNEVKTTSSVTIEGTCSMGSGRVVGDLRLSLNGPNTSMSTTRPTTSGSAAGFVWAVDLAYNGSYTATVVATGEDASPDPNGAEQSSTSVSFSVEAPPATPTGLDAKVNGNRTVSLTWKANSEPDLVGYQVQRASGTSDYAAIGNPKTASFVDEGTTGSGRTYKYRIVAVRQGARSGQGVTSSPSAVTSATVEDPPPPTTTPTTSAGGGNGGGDSGSGGSGGGSSGGGTTPTTVGSSSSSPSGTAGQAPTTFKGGGGGVDLSGFSRLLDQTRRAPAPVTPELDTGFSETLPFATPTTLDDAEPGEEAAGPALVQRPLSGPDRTAAVRFLAGGMMATVVAMVLMVIKGQVDLADQLDALNGVTGEGDLEAVEPDPSPEP